MDVGNLRWWGWGMLDRDFSVVDRPAFWPALREWLQLSEEAVKQERPPVSMEDLSLRPPRLDDPVLFSLRKLLGEEAVFTDTPTRLKHAYGKSYRDLIRLRAGHVPHPPDVVVYPADQADIVSLLAWAVERDIAVIPFGGGSSTSGGVEPVAGERLIITLDLAHLDHTLSIDHESRTARIQAGATGPEIEAELGESGHTLGHFPQSFEFSTLGGWIATRSVGQNAIGYGGMEDMVQCVRLVTPVGIVEAKKYPTVGPGLVESFVGSEGAYGVITEARVAISVLPKAQDYRCVLFRTLEDGVAALRDLAQSSRLSPSLVQLSDGPGTLFQDAQSYARHGFSRLTDVLADRYLNVRGYDPADGGVLLTAGFEGDPEWVSRQWSFALEMCGDHQGLSLGRAMGRSWIGERYAWPYLRDVLIAHGVLVGTVETAANWSNLMRLYRATVSATKGAISATGGGPGYVVTHISYVCPPTATLRVTFLGRQVAQADPAVKQAQWRAVKESANEAIVGAGGSVAYRSGIGCDHAPWLQEEVGRVGIKMLRALKRTLDPTNVMNPGVLLPSETDG